MPSLLSQEKISFFQNNGFVQIDNLLSAEELQELRESMDYVMNLKTGEGKSVQEWGGNKDNYLKVLNQRYYPYLDSPGVAKFTFQPRFAQMALELSGANGIVFHHDIVFYKMPGDSRPTWWHQDSPYFQIIDQKGLTLWIALDDVNENNGCMQFIPGSHKLGPRKSVDLADKEQKDIHETLKSTEYENQQPVVVPMKAGSCTFHHSSTYHYAFANRTEKPRRVYALEYLHDDALANDLGYYTKNFGIAAGQPIKGIHFPVVSR